MVIRNETKGTILSDNAVKATTFKHKTFGLILSPQGTAMIFQTRFGIHTFFMKYPIDVLVLDKENKVVSMKHNLQPNRIYVWNIKYQTIIELPTGVLFQTKTQIGEIISVLND